MNKAIRKGIISLRVAEVRLRHWGDYWVFVLKIDNVDGEYIPPEHFNTPHQALTEAMKTQVKLKF